MVLCDVAADSENDRIEDLDSKKAGGEGGGREVLAFWVQGLGFGLGAVEFNLSQNLINPPPIKTKQLKP